MSAGTLAIIIDVSHGFQQSHQANSGTVRQIRPQPLPSESFPTYIYHPTVYRYIIISMDNIYIYIYIYGI
jgi:hypothetical protein